MFITGWLLLAFSASGPTALHLDTAAIDFGTLPRFAERERSLPLHNTSDRTIGLGPIDADCVCLRGQLAARQLVAGESTAWQVRLHTCDTLGEAHRQMWLFDPATHKPLIRLAVRYRVVPDLFTDAAFVPLGFLGDESVVQEVAVCTAGERAFTLTAAGCSDGFVDVELLDRAVTRQHPGRLRVTVQGPLPTGTMQSAVWVDSDSVDVPRLRVPLFGESVDGLECNRREVLFEPRSEIDRCAQAVVIKHGHELSLVEFRTSDELVTVRAAEATADGTRIVLELRTPAPLGESRGFLQFETSALRRRVRIPYRIEMAESPTAPIELVNSSKPEPECKAPCGK